MTGYKGSAPIIDVNNLAKETLQAYKNEKAAKAFQDGLKTALVKNMENMLETILEGPVTTLLSQADM